MCVGWGVIFFTIVCHVRMQEDGQLRYLLQIARLILFPSPAVSGDRSSFFNGGQTSGVCDGKVGCIFLSGKM